MGLCFWINIISKLKSTCLCNFQATGYLRRAEAEQLKEIFEKYATAQVDGETYMTDEDFIVKFLKLFPEKDYNKDSAKLLCGILDQSKDG